MWMTSFKMVVLFDSLYLASKVTYNFLHRQNTHILNFDRKLIYWLDVLFSASHNNYKGIYILPYLSSYFLLARGNFLNAEKYFEMYIKRCKNIPKLKSSQNIDIEILSKIGHILNVSLDLQSFGIITNTTSEAYKMFSETEKDYLIGKNINKLFPRILRRGHRREMMGLNMKKLINKVRKFWLEREDGLLTPVSFILKFSTSLREGLTVNACLRRLY